jgi:hypothetical protein
MVSTIDPTVPAFGNPTTASERTNWTRAKADIEALQNGYAPLNNPHFTGTPTAPTPPPGDNDTSIATTAFVTAAVVASTSGVASFNSRTGAIALTGADITGAGGALLASPALTGTPTAPTPTTTDNTTKVATTAYVKASITAAAVPAPATANPQMDGAATAGVTTVYARGDHRHPTDTSRAPLDSPSFTNQATVNGSLFVTTNFYIDPANGWEWVHYRESSSGDHIHIHRAGWYDRWSSSGGTRTWVVNNQVGMTLDASGNFSVLGSLSGSVVNSSAGFALNQASSGGTWIADANWVYLRFSGTWGWQWDRSTGHLYYVNNSGTPLLQINNAGGGIRYNGIGGNNYFGFVWDAGQAQGAILAYVDGGNQGNLIHGFQGAAYGNCNAIAPHPSDATMQFWWSGGGFGYIVYTASDRKFKSNLAPTEFDALAATNALTVYDCDMRQPGADETDTTHWNCALIADEVRDVLPSGYVHAGDQQTGYDSINPLAMIAMLVRSVQQLKALNDDLTARIAALEAHPA